MGTVLQRLAARLHLGQLPEALRAQLESEGRILYVAEGVMETAVFRHFRAPNAYSRYRRISFIGYVLVAVGLSGLTGLSPQFATACACA